MKTINVPTREQVSAESQAIFDNLQKRIGKVPNLYAVMGYSGAALKGLLDLETTLATNVFTAKEREAVYLVVSEVNGCQYCLAAHTLTAIKRGFTKEETLQIRRGDAADSKLKAIVQLAKSITENKGKASDEAKENFFNAGYNETALMELIGLVVARTFTNYAYINTEVPIDFPAAEPLQ